MESVLGVSFRQTVKRRMTARLSFQSVTDKLKPTIICSIAPLNYRPILTIKTKVHKPAEFTEA